MLVGKEISVCTSFNHQSRIVGHPRFNDLNVYTDMVNGETYLGIRNDDGS